MTSILITGGTGYFGRAFVKRLLARSTCERICIYSRDEFKQAMMRQDLEDDPRLRFFVGDVRDLPRLQRAMAGCGVILHAAALKRVEVGEYNPTEMVKTNVMGTMNVIEAAQDAPLRSDPYPRRVVYLSTDKACTPVNAYGASKLMGEKLILTANNTVGKHGPLFSVTRYGNIAGSTGSVVPIWRKMIKEGATEVPVTDPECTRFWMHIDQAVDLVLHTVETMKGGERNIPILAAYRLGDLAEAMGVGIKVVGMRPGEKKHEAIDEGATSDITRRLTVSELQEELKYV